MSNKGQRITKYLNLNQNNNDYLVFFGRLWFWLQKFKMSYSKYKNTWYLTESVEIFAIIKKEIPEIWML